MPRLRQAFIVALIVAVVYCWAPPAREADWTEVLRKEIEPTPGGVTGYHLRPVDGRIGVNRD